MAFGIILLRLIFLTQNSIFYFLVSAIFAVLIYLSATYLMDRHIFKELKEALI
jgi:hypothetical protein